MKAIFVLVAIASGVGSTLQSGSNATLQKALASPLWTVVFVSAVTLVASVIVTALSGAPFPNQGAFAYPPWWAWIGGLFGLGFVLATVYASPKLGAGLFVALIVTASTVSSLVLDHYGLMGFDLHKAGVGRILGALLMIAGVGCIAAV